MKQLLKFWLPLVFLVAGTNPALPAQGFRSLVYYEGDSLRLELDLFLPDGDPQAAAKPLVIFVHGGGFSGGDRTAGHQLCRHLAGKGMVAATISYTLYMRGKSFSCDGMLTEKIKAIQIATNQLWLATAFFLQNKDAYGIDGTQIFIAGSSAGAETALHAAFWDRELMNLYPVQLPAGFRYAGLISGAGAIMDLNLIREDTMIPVMLFHGDADPVVPYATAAHHYCPTNASGWLMLFGSRSIYEHMARLGGTVSLITHAGGKHGIAGAHFFQDQEPVSGFIRQVLDGETFQAHITKKAH
jgi:predicted peptidase